jgi:hypothetical protein
MTSPENFGPQFKDHITLYRGIGGVTPEHLKTDELGVHWTEDYETAKKFANPDHPFNAGAEHPDDGVIIEAKVPASGVLNRRSKEFRDLANEKMILSKKAENETTIRPGTEVHLNQLHHLKYDDYDDFGVDKVIPLEKPGTV